MDESALRELYRSNFGLFAQRFIRIVAPNLKLEWNWHHDLICHRLEKLARGEIERLLICVPPRSLKSLLCSVLFPAWLLGIRPSEAVLCISYAQPLAETFARQTRQIMDSEPYKTTFTTRLSREKRAVEHFETTEGGVRIASSVGGTVTGRGGETIILDDPMKPEEAVSESGRRTTLEWAGNTLASRPNSKLNVRMLCIMQRLHEQDIAAEFIAQGWEVLSLPAIAVEPEEYQYDTIAGPETTRRSPGDVLHPEREPLHVLERLKRSMGTFTFEAQYQQQPAPEDGNLFRRNWVRSYSPAEAYGFDQIIGSWDTASKEGQHNDFSVCTTWGLKNRHCYLLHVHREKLTFPDLKNRVVELAKRFDAQRVLIEDRASGISLIQLLQGDGFYKAIAFKPKGSKIERLHGVTPMFEGGGVLLPERAEWLEAYLHEMCAFPRGKHDDQVDSTTQALEWARTEGAEDAIFVHYRREAESRRAFTKDRTVRLRAPGSVSSVYLKDGQMVSVGADRTILVTPEDAGPLRLAGFTDVRSD
jgi:predicted phage terminase large subunit-like protein